MAKPAALSQAMDCTGQLNFVMPSASNDVQISRFEAPATDHFPALAAKYTIGTSSPSTRCTCHSKSWTTVWRSPYDLIGMGTVSIAQHHRSCPLSVYRKDYQISTRYKFPRWLLNKALYACFSTSYGAGGFSMAPYLGIISVVTPDNPAILSFRKVRYDTIGRRPVTMIDID